MTRWWESAGELREFHVDRDGTSLAEWLGLLPSTEISNRGWPRGVAHNPSH